MNFNTIAVNKGDEAYDRTQKGFNGNEIGTTIMAKWNLPMRVETVFIVEIEASSGLLEMWPM